MYLKFTYAYVLITSWNLNIEFFTSYKRSYVLNQTPYINYRVLTIKTSHYNTNDAIIFASLKY